MIVINTVDSQRFSFNGIEYFKNFTPVIAGDTIKIVNTYDSNLQLLASTNYADFTVDGSSYASAALLQSALLPVLFTRDTLGGGGGTTLFTGLTDTPSSYAGQADKKVVVNSGETALEFVDDNSGGGLNVIQNHSVVNLVSNTWRGHNNFSTIWLTSSPDTSYGTGATPNKSGSSFQNSNCLYVRDKQQLTSLVFNCRVTTNAKNIDIIVYAFDYNDDRQSELNEQILVQETMVLSGTSNSVELTVLPHTLSSNSVIYVFYKHVSGTLSALRGVMLNYKFD